MITKRGNRREAGSDDASLLAVSSSSLRDRGKRRLSVKKRFCRTVGRSFEIKGGLFSISFTLKISILFAGSFSSLQHYRTLRLCVKKCSL